MTKKITKDISLHDTHQQMQNNLLRDESFMSSQLKVLFYIIEHTDDTGLAIIEQKQVAEQLNMTQPTACRSLARLVEDHPDIVIRKASNVFQLHPDFLKQYSVCDSKID